MLTIFLVNNREFVKLGFLQQPEVSNCEPLHAGHPLGEGQAEPLHGLGKNKEGYAQQIVNLCDIV